MRKLIFPIALVFFLSSCQDDSQKAADELCDCLSSKAKGFSSGFKKFMKKIGASDNPGITFKKEFEKLDGEDKTDIQEEINKLIKIDDINVRSCSKKIAEYKVRGKTEEDRHKKVLDLMAGKSGCEIGSAQWALALEKMYNSKDEASTDDDETETDKPKKKKITEEE